MRILLIGNHGVGNFGDEALKEYFRGLFAYRDHDVVTISARPEGANEVARLPVGVRSFFSFAWIATLGEFRRCDAVVFGGGTLFTDVESLKACILWGLHAFAAVAFRKPYHLASQGIGPFKTGAGEAITRRVVSRACSISVRDAHSAERMERLFKNKKFILTFDPVVLLYQKRKPNIELKNVFIVIPRRNSEESFVSRAKILHESANESKIRILSFQHTDTAEQKMCTNLLRALPQAELRDIRVMDDLVDACESASRMFSARFHGSLYALITGIPFEVESQGKGDKHGSLELASDPASCVEAATKGERHLLSSLESCACGKHAARL